MHYNFPAPVRIVSFNITPEGLRHQPFTNIDGETFSKPALNGFWRIEMRLLAVDVQSFHALSGFINSMRMGGATCDIPVTTQWLPNSDRGRTLNGFNPAPAYTLDHVGFASEPFDGFTLRAPASHRDSYIDVNKPALSHLAPGHFISLGDRLHQVRNASAIGESETAARVSILPNVRGAHPAGEIVIVDQLRVRCQMQDADPVGASGLPHAEIGATFIEAF